MLLLMMMLQCTSSAPGTTPPLTTHCGFVQFDGTGRGAKAFFQSVGVTALEQQPDTAPASLVADDSVQRSQVKGLLSATVTKESSFRSTAPSPHQTYDRWPLLLLEIDTYTIIYFTENHRGLNGSRFLRFFQTCEGKMSKLSSSDPLCEKFMTRRLPSWHLLSHLSP